MTGERIEQRYWWWLLGGITAAGLALRIAAAQGGLWLDEAWSATLARDVGTPLGIFLNINHDNNHHLNSLWLQTVGFGAPPVIARGLSIVTGTAAIVIAGLIGRRRDPQLGLITAVMFAVSPVLVTLGSEARGYAPMSLAFLTAILLTDRWLDGDAKRSPATALALCFFLGALSQLTMLFGFCAIAGWVFFTLWRRHRALLPAIRESLGLLLPSIIAIGLVLALVLGAAAASKTGFQFGRYEPFSWLLFLHGIIELISYTAGNPGTSLWWLIVPPVAVLLAPGFGVRRVDFYRLAVIAFPLMLALLHAGNVGHPRYYLVLGLALLLLLCELFWVQFRTDSWKSWVAGFGLGVMFGGGLAADFDLIKNQRGDPDVAIAAIKERMPNGAQVLLDRDTGYAMLEASAAHAHYPLEIVQRECPPARFLFVDRFRGEAFPAAWVRCGRRYEPIVHRYAIGMSGTHWTLYEIRP